MPSSWFFARALGAASAAMRAARRGTDAFAGGRGGLRATEREIDEVTRVLSPGPVASGPSPLTAEETTAAADAVDAATRAWRERPRA